MAGFKPDQLASMDPTAMAGFKSEPVAAWERPAARSNVQEAAQYAVIKAGRDRGVQ